MGSFNLQPIVYGTYMATVDVFMLGILKAINLGWMNKVFIFLPTLLYSMQPWVFLASLKFEGLTVMNLMWDVMSDVLVTFMGLFFFQEKLKPSQLIGLFFAFGAIFFLTCGEACGF
jgi:multidrug transporter EmrE-like cation transporter